MTYAPIIGFDLRPRISSTKASYERWMQFFLMLGPSEQASEHPELINAPAKVIGSCIVVLKSKRQAYTRQVTATNT